LGPQFGTPIWDPNVIRKIKQNSSDMNKIILAPCDVISKIKQNYSDMNKIILAPCDVIRKIKQNSSDMNEIILTPCDAGYVQSCTGYRTYCAILTTTSRKIIIRT
jgi:tRNA G26 N,N-dimethylase Trm1